MTIIEIAATFRLNKQRQIQRQAWGSSTIKCNFEGILYWVISEERYSPTLDDIIATDWDVC